MVVTQASGKTRDYFDFVLDDDIIRGRKDCPSRWPDVGNGSDDDEDPEDAPPIVEVSTKEVFFATQPMVSDGVVRAYSVAIANGADMPPLAAIKCKDGIIVWNGHHRLSASRLAGVETIRVRFWATFDEEFIKHHCDKEG